MKHANVLLHLRTPLRPRLLAIEAEREPDKQDLIDAYPEIEFELHRDDEWLTGPIALPEPRPIKQAEENNESDA